MYYHLITQRCSVFLNSLYISLMYYGFVFMAFSEPHFVQLASMFLTLSQIFMIFGLKKMELNQPSLCGFCRSLGSENVNYEKPQTINLLLFIDCKILRLILFHVTVVLKYGFKTVKSGNTL